MLPRAVGQPSPDDLLLEERELGRAARGGAGPQAPLALVPVCGDPAADRPRLDIEELGDLLGGIPLQDALDGKKSSAFEFRRGACVSHT
jgi:hypothetical protein